MLVFSRKGENTMTETLKNLLNRVAADIHAVTIGFAILQGYL